MQPIANPIDKNILEQELTNDKFVRDANNGSNKIYIINHHNSPNVMTEIGRLRELTFRTAGGGTGKSLDIDEYDTAEKCYQQLIVWNPEDKEIVGGYRFINCAHLDNTSQLATSHLFTFSEKFVKEYFPYTIELGRSFVQPNYQPSVNNRKGLFSLDNLWDGLGALVVDNPEVKYFFGKFTMYTDFNQKARDMILFFLNTYFPDKEKLVFPHKPLSYFNDVKEFETLFNPELEYKEAHKILNQNVRTLGENIPPLVNAYMNLSATMKTFGTCVNNEFGDVEETGIMVTINDIYPTKKERHVQSYIENI